MIYFTPVTRSGRAVHPLSTSNESLAHAVGQEICRAVDFQISNLLGEKRENH